MPRRTGKGVRGGTGKGIKGRDREGSKGVEVGRVSGKGQGRK